MLDETERGEAVDQNFPATDDPLPEKAGETVRTKLVCPLDRSVDDARRF